MRWREKKIIRELPLVLKQAIGVADLAALLDQVMVRSKGLPSQIWGAVRRALVGSSNWGRLCTHAMEQ